MNVASPAPEPTAPTGPFLLVGLRNPGEKYAGTRHNVGAEALTALAAELSSRPIFTHQKKLRAEVMTARLPAGATAILCAPTSYMNESGLPVAAVARYYSVPPAQVIVLHDDLDLDFGTIRLKRGGGEGGHNGLRSLTAHLKTREYLRVRIGIGRPPGRMDPASYVLKPFATTERPEVPLLCAEAAAAALLLTRASLTDAQNVVHAR